jgi:hypothetical protein
MSWKDNCSVMNIKMSQAGKLILYHVHVMLSIVCYPAISPPESSNTTSGTMYLKEQGFYPPVQKWYAQLALGCILLGILLLTYLRLRFMRKTR